LTSYPKEADAITLGKDISGWFREEPPWPEVVGEVFLFENICFPKKVFIFPIPDTRQTALAECAARHRFQE
jgi:hypothetical protein